MLLWDGAIEERVIDLKHAGQVEAVRQFLGQFQLSFTEKVDYTVALYRDERMIATGSLDGEVLRNIAIDESLQGEGLTAAVISHLMKEAGRRGIYHYFIFTKTNKAHLFSALGFKEVGRAEPYAVLLEAGIGSIEKHCRELSRQVMALPPGSRAGLVVNCNPFTLGHKAVIARAAVENEAVVVLVVSEEKSVFPFAVRLRLVKQGLAGLQNIVVLPAGKYSISAATFPGYFTSGDATVAAQTRLDAGIFGHHIAPALGITRRYIGDEPYSPVTRAYNAALQEILPRYGIAVCEMKRMAVAQEAVSASRVRALLREEEWEKIRSLVPETTFQYLVSAEALPVIRKIQAANKKAKNRSNLV